MMVEVKARPTAVGYTVPDQLYDSGGEGQSYQDIHLTSSMMVEVKASPTRIYT